MEKENQPQKKKWYKKWWVIAIFAVAVLIIIGAVSGGDKTKDGFKDGFEAGKQKTEEPAKNEQTVNPEVSEVKSETALDTVENETIKSEQNNKQKENAKEESRITRSEIIKLFPEFNIKKAVDVSGEENYTGKTNDDSIFQIIGSEDNLSEIALTMVMSAQSVENMDKQGEYLNRLLGLLIPGTKSYELIGLNDTGDKITKGGYEIEYSYMTFGGGTYSETYTFRK